MTTPADLAAAVSRAIADDATPDDRRAGRQACLILAAALGEPGDPMAPPTAQAAAAARPSKAQLLDLAMRQMQDFIDQDAERAKAAAANVNAQAASSPPPATATAPSPPHTTRPAPSSRQSPPPLNHRPLYFPMVRPLPRRQSP